MKILLFLIAFLTVSCSGTGDEYRPIIDNPGPNYGNDLFACQELAKQRKYLNGDSKTKALAGAGIGAAGGALVGSSGGGQGTLAGGAAGAAIGAAAGLASGAFEAKEEKKYIIVQCLRNRGYNVIM
jgi:hypothetical protein